MELAFVPEGSSREVREDFSVCVSHVIDYLFDDCLIDFIHGATKRSCIGAVCDFFESLPRCKVDNSCSEVLPRHAPQVDVWLVV